MSTAPFPLCLCAAPFRAKVPQPLLQPEHLPCLDPGPQHCHHHSLLRSRAPGRPDSNSSPLLPPLPPSDARIYVLEPLAIWRALRGSLLPSIRWRWTGFIPGGGPLIRTPTDPTPLPRCPSNLHCTNAIPCIAHVHVLTLTAQLRQDAEEVVVQVSPSSFRLSISTRCQLSEGMRVLGGFCDGQVARSRAGELSCACLCASMHV